MSLRAWLKPSILTFPVSYALRMESQSQLSEPHGFLLVCVADGGSLLAVLAYAQGAGRRRRPKGGGQGYCENAKRLLPVQEYQTYVTALLEHEKAAILRFLVVSQAGHK